MVHQLMTAYKLNDRTIVVPSVPATEEEIRTFHSEDYVEFLKTAKPSDDDESEDVFGLGVFLYIYFNFLCINFNLDFRLRTYLIFPLNSFRI